MRLRGFSAWALRIPLVEAYRHGHGDRAWCDAVVVRVEDDGGEVGYGEGTPRPHVTGETAEAMVRHLADNLWPAVAGRELPDLQAPADLEALSDFIPATKVDGALSDNASRCALEIAILDCALRRSNRGLGRLLPPVRQRVVYGGVIASGSLDRALQQARQFRTVGLRHVKVRVGLDGKKGDIERVRAVREVLGPDVSLRVDAGGAWNPEQALDILWALAPFRIDAVEQPIPRGPVAELAELKRRSPVPIMVGDSLVTEDDARALIAAGAIDFFDVQISRCGGLSRALAIGRMAAGGGIGLQIGSQVGETAILAGAGRHLAAHLENVAFVEGSLGTLALVEDLSPDGIRFGHKGEAPVLGGQGLGVRVLEDRLHRYAVKQVSLVAPHAAGRQSTGTGLTVSPFLPPES